MRSEGLGEGERVEKAGERFRGEAVIAPKSRAVDGSLVAVGKPHVPLLSLAVLERNLLEGGLFMQKHVGLFVGPALLAVVVMFGQGCCRHRTNIGRYVVRPKNPGSVTVVAYGDTRTGFFGSVTIAASALTRLSSRQFCGTKSPLMESSSLVMPWSATSRCGATRTGATSSTSRNTSWDPLDTLAPDPRSRSTRQSETTKP